MGVKDGHGVAAGQDSSPQPIPPRTRIVRAVIEPNGRGQIVVDGVDLSLAVNGIEFRSAVGIHAEPPTMTLSLVAPVIEFDGQVSVEVRERTRAALIALGWTPPDGD